MKVQSQCKWCAENQKKNKLRKNKLFRDEQLRKKIVPFD